MSIYANWRRLSVMGSRRVDFRSADFDALAELWNGFLPVQYKIDAEILRSHTVGSSLFDWGASCIQLEDDRATAFVAVKRSAARLYRGPDPDNAHLNSIAFSNTNAGIDVLAHAKTVLASRGIARLVLGQDSGHLLPGCPSNFKQLCSFFLVEGFVETSQVHDLERDLGDYEDPSKPVSRGEFRPLEESDRDGLMAFFEREFPGRWRHDVLEKSSQEGMPNSVFGLLLDGKVEGFALLQDSSHKYQIGGAVWRIDLGSHWGSLGPIGVSKAVRGKGLGDALLGKALLHLKSKGVRRCIIDWTGLVEFYGKHGFEVTRTYQGLQLPLDPSL